MSELKNLEIKIISNPSREEWEREVFCGFDVARGPDIGRDYVLWIDANGRVAGLLDEKKPTGHIDFDGKPMAFWLPPGVTAESIGVQPIKQEA